MSAAASSCAIAGSVGSCANVSCSSSSGGAGSSAGKEGACPVSGFPPSMLSNAASISSCFREGTTGSSGAGGCAISVSRALSGTLSNAAAASSRGGRGGLFSGSWRIARRSKRSFSAGEDIFGWGISLFMTMIDPPHFRHRMRAPFPLILDSSNRNRAWQAWH